MNISTEQVFLVNSAELEQNNLHTAGPLQPILQRNFTMPVAAVHPEAPHSSSMCLPQPLDAPSHTQMCRLCATVTELVVPIFEGEGLQNGLADKIHQHLPIKVCEKDVLPVVLCFQCTSTLLAWHELVLCCVQADSAMRERLHQPQLQQPTVLTSQTEIKHEQSTHKPSKIIKTTLTEYLRFLNMDDQVTVVCQKCENNPIFTPQGFTYHLAYTHDLAKSGKEDILSFIGGNVTFEEALVSGMESDADSDSQKLVDRETVEVQEMYNVKELDESQVCFIEESELNDSIDAQTPTQVSLPTLLCPFCDSAFSSPTRLIHHLGTHMEISIDDGVQCCDVIYSTKKDYVTHLQENHVSRLLYNTDTMCKSCSYKASTSKELTEHIKQWHYEKPKQKKQKETVLNQKFIPAVCPECEQVFSNKYNMMMHLKSHGKQETFKCGRCDKEYSTKGNLAQHVRLAHEGKLPYACEGCGERFATRAARDIHSRIHTGEKPFHCDVCNKRFRAKNTLLRHLDIHRGVRKHECPTCNKKFSKWSHLSAHFRVHRK